MAESGPGKIRLFTEFSGIEVPLATAVAVGTSAGGCTMSLGDFSLKGKIELTDAGAPVIATLPGGAIRLTNTNEDGEGAALTTANCFSPALNGPLVLEARVQMADLATKNVYIGFTDAIVNSIIPPLTSDTITHTLTASDLAGFHMDTSLTAGTTWHCPFNGGTVTGDTDSRNTTTAKLPVAAEWDVLRVIVQTNGTVEYWLNGNREFRIVNAVSTSVLQGAVVGIWGSTTTVKTMDVDYILVTANRDWTR